MYSNFLKIFKCNPLYLPVRKLSPPLFYFGSELEWKFLTGFMLNIYFFSVSRSSSSSPGQLISPPAELRALVPAGRTPPPPPPRWAKPGHNFTVTTTVTFSVNNAATTTPPPHVEVSCVQVFLFITCFYFT